jgi:hypothetical protein
MVARRSASSSRLPKKRARRYGDDERSHAAQLAWTVLVALGVAVAGLYQLAAPKRVLMSRDQQIVRPEAWRTPAATRSPATALASEVAPD